MLSEIANHIALINAFISTEYCMHLTLLDAKGELCVRRTGDSSLFGHYGFVSDASGFVKYAPAPVHFIWSD